MGEEYFTNDNNSVHTAYLLKDLHKIWKKLYCTNLYSHFQPIIFVFPFFNSDERHFSFIETSALDSSNVGEAFNNLLIGKFIYLFITKFVTCLSLDVRTCCVTLDHGSTLGKFCIDVHASKTPLLNFPLTNL